MIVKRKIKVAQIIGNVAEGGIEMMIMNLFRYINRSEVEFHFLVPNTSIIINKEEIEELGGRVIVTPKYNHYFKYKKFLKELFLKEKYDVVHANMNALSFIPLKVAKKCGINIRVSHCHSTSHKKEHIRHLIKELLKPFSKRYATHLFACSEKAGRWLYGDKAFNSGNVIIINNGIDFNKYKYDEGMRRKIRNGLSIPNNAKVVGHIGRFMTQKNHPYLIRIFTELLKVNSNSYLLLVGSGENLDSIKDMVTTLNINNVIFTGSVTNANDYYQAMDCFCLPSLYEGLPVVGVEAQINGLKCFFSNEITEEARLLEETEFLKLSDSPLRWATSIDNFFKKNVIRIQTSLKNDFDIKMIASKLLEVYRHALYN